MDGLNGEECGVQKFQPVFFECLLSASEGKSAYPTAMLGMIVRHFEKGYRKLII